MCLSRHLEAHGHGSSAGLTLAEKEAAEIDIKYAGFLKRQERQLQQARPVPLAVYFRPSYRTGSRCMWSTPCSMQGIVS